MKPSYLGAMPEDERAMAVALAAKAAIYLGPGQVPGGPAAVIVKGGYFQFMAICRPIFRNWGATNRDLENAWNLLVMAATDPKQFNQLTEFLIKRSEQKKPMQTTGRVQ